MGAFGRLAVVLVVAALTFLVGLGLGLVWRLVADPPLRDVVVRNESGQIIGSGRTRMLRPQDATASTAEPLANEPADVDAMPERWHRSVKSIAIRHGSTVYCENRPDDGACFVVQLPLISKFRLV